MLTCQSYEAAVQNSTKQTNVLVSVILGVFGNFCQAFELIALTGVKPLHTYMGWNFSKFQFASIQQVAIKHLCQTCLKAYRPFPMVQKCENSTDNERYIGSSYHAGPYPTICFFDLCPDSYNLTYMSQCERRLQTPNFYVCACPTSSLYSTYFLKD